MARINRYTPDSNISGSDKVLGTDALTGTTKNFTLESFKEWLNISEGIGVSGQKNFRFQTEGNNAVDRTARTISFNALGGDGTLFSEITELVFSSTSASGYNASNYISTLVGNSILISDTSDYGNFGIYKLVSFTEIESEPGFYTAVLQFSSGNGSVSSDKTYGVASYSVAGGITQPQQLIPMRSEDDSVFDIAVTNDGNLIVIPEGSTEPVILSPPVITGTLKVWYTLGAIAGGVTGSPQPVRTWQWQRSDTGLNWVDIPGATNATYTLAIDDADKYIRVQQTETNVLDSVTSPSETPDNAIIPSIFETTEWQNITPVTWGALTVQTWN
jgi:hypothetical protein